MFEYYYNRCINIYFYTFYYFLSTLTLEPQTYVWILLNQVTILTYRDYLSHNPNRLVFGVAEEVAV